MLLTLTATSLGSMVARPGGDGAVMTLSDLPAFAKQTLGLHGLNLTTEMLSGLGVGELESLRERGDKHGCAFLMLAEPEPQALWSADPGEAEAALERCARVIKAASLLGCNAAAVTPAGPDEDRVLLGTAEALKRLMARAERLELNLLVSPGAGLTASPERVTELLKKVGGFRVGTLPDFQTAAASEDPGGYMRRLTPYASVVSASTVRFTTPEGGDPGGDYDAQVEHAEYDLDPLVEAVVSVGYDGTLAVDYRGGGDRALGVIRSRTVLEEALAREAAR
jgi:sugar phosphate isomerase/epimerase